MREKRKSTKQAEEKKTKKNEGKEEKEKGKRKKEVIQKKAFIKIQVDKLMCKLKK